jgi:hypothetical protein
MIKYDESYYYNLLKIHTHSAQYISILRWDFLHEYLHPVSYKCHPVILDYGCGVGWFKAFASELLIVDTFDIMPVPQTGIIHDKYDMVTMWDVLEHIPDFSDIAHILAKTDYVALTVPIKPDNVVWADYKHFKISEHLHYFTVDLLEAMFDHYGFKLVKQGEPECPPREFIKSFIFGSHGVVPVDKIKKE